VPPPSQMRQVLAPSGLRRRLCAHGRFYPGRTPLVRLPPSLSRPWTSAAAEARTFSAA
jgi:hypothetical protein